VKTLPFSPLERFLLSRYAQWAGGLAAPLVQSRTELQHHVGQFLTGSKLLAPWLEDARVCAFIRREFEHGWKLAQAGQPPEAPCGWRGSL
jgi:hypothetical protein